MPIFFVAFVSILMSVAAQFCLKAGMSSDDVRLTFSEPIGFHSLKTLASNPFLILGFSLYGLGAIVWLQVLAKWDVSKAYPLVGLGFVATLGIGHLLGEHITTQRIIGCGLICGGIFMITRS